MTRDEQITHIVERLKEVDEKSAIGLVNFVDDTIDWFEIATVALDAATEVTEGQK